MQTGIKFLWTGDWVKEIITTLLLISGQVGVKSGILNISGSLLLLYRDTLKQGPTILNNRYLCENICLSESIIKEFNLLLKLGTGKNVSHWLIEKISPRRDWRMDLLSSLPLQLSQESKREQVYSSYIMCCIY